MQQAYLDEQAKIAGESLKHLLNAEQVRLISYEITLYLIVNSYCALILDRCLRK